MHAYVRDIMTTGVVTVRPDTPYREIAAMFREHQVSGFPVTAEDGTVIGVVSESDLIALAAGRQHRGHCADDQATAGDLMTHPAVTIGPHDLVQTAARVMHSRRLQRLRRHARISLMNPMDSSVTIFGDWGTSRLRLYLRQGLVLARRR